MTKEEFEKRAMGRDEGFLKAQLVCPVGGGFTAREWFDLGHAQGCADSEADTTDKAKQVVKILAAQMNISAEDVIQVVLAAMTQGAKDERARILGLLKNHYGAPLELCCDGECDGFRWADWIEKRLSEEGGGK